MNFKTIYLFVLCLSVKTQAQNLILNPSFEIHSQCPSGMGQLASCTTWSDAASNSSCEYYSGNNCSNNFSPPLLQPVTWVTWYQQPLAGKSFIGFIPYYGPTGLPSYTEYVQGAFSQPLTASAVYYVEFYVNATSGTRFTLHDLAALITDTSGGVNHNNLQNYAPQITPPSGVIFRDTTKWMRISGYYTAHGGESFITLGNFTPRGQEIKDSVPTGLDEAYYFIDSVGIYEVTHWDAWSAGPDKTINSGDSVEIGNPCTDYSTFNWITSGGGTTHLTDSSNSWPYAKPIQTTTYYVTKSQGALIFQDTVTVFVNGSGVEQKTTNAAVTIYPNPNNGSFTVQIGQVFKQENVWFEIMDVNGKTIAKYNFPPSTNPLDIATDKFENGIYLYRLIGNKNSCAGKIIVFK